MKVLVLSLSLLAASWAGAPPAPAQDPSPPVPPVAQEEPAPSDLAGVRARIAELEATEGGDEAARQEALERFRHAEQLFVQADEWQRQAAEYELEIAEGPVRLEALQAELAEPPTPREPQVPEGATVQQVEDELEKAQAQLDGARLRLEELVRAAEERAQRRTSIPDELARDEQRLRELIETLAAADSGSGLPRSRRSELEAERKLLDARVRALELELAAFDVRRGMQPARRDRAQRQVTQAEALVAACQSVAQQVRAAEAARAAQEARRLAEAAARQHEGIHPLAQSVEDLAKERQELLQRMTDAVARQTSVKDELARVEKAFRDTKRKLDAAGLTNTMGILLRRQLGELPGSAALRRRSQTRQAEIGRAQLAAIECEDTRAEIGVPATTAAELVDGLDFEGTPEERQLLLSVAEGLVTTKKETLQELVLQYDRYVERLLETERARQRLIEASEEFRDYIEERILWVRSIEGRSLPPLDELQAGLAWLVDGEGWSSGVRVAGSTALKRWPSAGALVALLLVLLGLHRRLVAVIERTAQLAKRSTTDRFALTIEALAATVGIAARWPLTMMLVAWLLRAPEEQPSVVLAVSSALDASAQALFALTFFQALVRKEGLGEVHFRWPTSTVKSLRRALRWFVPAALPLFFLWSAMARRTDDPAYDEGVGRLAFVAAMVPLTWFLHRVLRQDGPVMSAYARRNPDAVVVKLRHVWHGLAVLMPVSSALLALLGYYYSAAQMQVLLRDTLLFLFALIVVNALLLRWLYVARQRLALEKARQRRAERRASAESEEGAELASVEEEELDIPAIDAQTRGLFRSLIGFTVVVGLYLIWAGVLPALKVLDRVQIWPELRVAELTEDAPSEPSLEDAPREHQQPSTGESASTALPGQLFSNGGAAAVAGGSREAAAVDVITLLDALLGMLVLALTLVAVRNIPGLLEIAVLQRLPLDAGSRYAVSHVARYAITIFGVVMAFSELGIGWSKVQWLAAALTFGLAFGLQEIFANFVSGLIILFERPVRVGDVVTVDGIEGKVTRIRMRATTIVDRDRRELLVPNRDFITGKLINWTLTDPITRLVLPVGIAYGSETRKAAKLMIEAANESKYVVAEPRSRAVFLEFGDSALNFELRTFITNRDLWAEATDDILLRIDDKFREAGIEISFPQRDLHVRSWSPPVPIERAGEAGPQGT